MAFGWGGGVPRFPRKTLPEIVKKTVGGGGGGKPTPLHFAKQHIKHWQRSTLFQHLVKIFRKAWHCASSTQCHFIRSIAAATKSCRDAVGAHLCIRAHGYVWPQNTFVAGFQVKETPSAFEIRVFDMCADCRFSQASRNCIVCGHSRWHGRQSLRHGHGAHASRHGPATGETEELQARFRWIVSSGERRGCLTNNEGPQCQPRSCCDDHSVSANYV